MRYLRSTREVFTDIRQGGVGEVVEHLVLQGPEEITEHAAGAVADRFGEETGLARELSLYGFVELYQPDVIRRFVQKEPALGAGSLTK